MSTMIPRRCPYAKLFKCISPRLRLYGRIAIVSSDCCTTSCCNDHAQSYPAASCSRATSTRTTNSTSTINRRQWTFSSGSFQQHTCLNPKITGIAAAAVMTKHYTANIKNHNTHHCHNHGSSRSSSSSSTTGSSTPSRDTDATSTKKTATTATTTTNYFQLLQQPQSYSISLPLLKESYQSQMKTLHPDKHTLQSLEKQREVADLSSKVIRGYEVLKDDYQRALHLLELVGEGVEEEQTTGKDQVKEGGKNGRDDHDLVGMDVLLMVMEIRERIDGIAVVAAAGDGMMKDDKGGRTELVRLMEENNGRIEETVDMLKGAFERNDWVEAKRLVATLQYWNRIKESIVEKL